VWGAQVTARDDSGQICSQATRQLPTGMLAADGPPTTLSPTGVDRVAFLQGNLTRDATYFVNGSPVGARDIFVVSPCLLPRMPPSCILSMHRVDVQVPTHISLQQYAALSVSSQIECKQVCRRV